MSEMENYQQSIQHRLRSVPRWACVAFAARCARRVQPLFDLTRPGMSVVLITAVERAISQAEKSATNTGVTGSISAAKGAVTAAANAAAHADAHAAANAALTALAAHNAAQDLSNADKAVDNASKAVDNADKAIMAYSNALNPAGPHAFSIYAGTKAIERDLILLEQLAAEEQWTDQTSVPPETFGLLWPDGVPRDWPVDSAENKTEPEEEQAPQGVKIEVAVPADADEDEIAAYLANLAAAMSAVHRSYGGSGLKPDAVHVYEPCLQPQEAGS